MRHMQHYLIGLKPGVDHGQSDPFEMLDFHDESELRRFANYATNLLVEGVNVISSDDYVAPHRPAYVLVGFQICTKQDLLVRIYTHACLMREIAVTCDELFFMLVFYLLARVNI